MNEELQNCDIGRQWTKNRKIATSVAKRIA
jgi:hypothetical protein